MGNRIGFVNAILKNEKIIKVKQRVYYSLRKYEKMGSYDILINISEHVTLVQLMDSLGNLIMLSVLLDTGYLTQNTKNYLYLIDNRWI